jgi:hypothetical protein
MTKTKKCFSGCRKFIKNRNILKKKKKITKKNTFNNKTKKHKTNTKNKLLQYGSSGTKKEHLYENRENALKKVGNFVLKNKSKLRTNYLKTICADSGACISFGTEVKKINELFDNFVNFNYAISPVKTIGIVSINGFVKEIKYSRNDYDSYAVLKSCAASAEADNLMYEYEVGINFVNKQNKIFPCFLETYGLFLYKDDVSWENSMNSNQMRIEELKSCLQEQKSIDYTIGCPNYKNVAILIQHIKDAKTFGDLIYEISQEKIYGEKLTLTNNDMPYLLYQIYMPLATLADQFTHYDLHANNVLLYEPIKGSYMTYYYHLTSGKTVEFNSKYIVKIIDYGRCYYNNGTQNSLDTYKKICETTECTPKRGTDCGSDFGFAVLNPEERPGAFHFITSQKKNSSIDMRFINIIKEELNKDIKYMNKSYLTLFKHMNSAFVNLLDKIVYDSPKLFFPTSFGTREILEPGKEKNKINNVKDLCEELGEYINQHAKIDIMYYYELPKIGDFHIYQDGRPMNFIKA